jgi:hypothetical protein
MNAAPKRLAITELNCTSVLSEGLPTVVCIAMRDLLEIILPGIRRRLLRAGVIGTLIAGVITVKVIVPIELDAAARQAERVSAAVESAVAEQIDQIVREQQRQLERDRVRDQRPDGR